MGNLHKRNQRVPIENREHFEYYPQHQANDDQHLLVHSLYNQHMVDDGYVQSYNWSVWNSDNDKTDMTCQVHRRPSQQVRWQH
jgi:hypothetical protein